MVEWPWLRPIPWYKKITRVLHCMFSMMGPVVYIEYLIEDLNYILDHLLFSVN